MHSSAATVVVVVIIIIFLNWTELKKVAYKIDLSTDYLKHLQQ